MKYGKFETENTEEIFRLNFLSVLLLKSQKLGICQLYSSLLQPPGHGRHPQRIPVIGMWFPMRRSEEGPAGLGERGLNLKLGFQKVDAALCVIAK